MEYKRVNNDINGNPRYVFHFLDCIPERERVGVDAWEVSRLFYRTLNIMKTLGGRKYRGKDFGGGIVFKSHDIDGTIAKIKALKSDMDNHKTF